jgi:hypothetical protein
VRISNSIRIGVQPGNDVEAAAEDALGQEDLVPVMRNIEFRLAVKFVMIAVFLGIARASEQEQGAPPIPAALPFP